MAKPGTRRAAPGPGNTCSVRAARAAPGHEGRMGSIAEDGGSAVFDTGEERSEGSRRKEVFHGNHLACVSRRRSTSDAVPEREKAIVPGMRAPLRRRMAHRDKAFERSSKPVLRDQKIYSNRYGPLSKILRGTFASRRLPFPPVPSSRQCNAQAKCKEMVRGSNSAPFASLVSDRNEGKSSGSPPKKRGLRALIHGQTTHNSSQCRNIRRGSRQVTMSHHGSYFHRLFSKLDQIAMQSNHFGLLECTEEIACMENLRRLDVETESRLPADGTGPPCIHESGIDVLRGKKNIPHHMRKRCLHLPDSPLQIRSDSLYVRSTESDATLDQASSSWLHSEALGGCCSSSPLFSSCPSR